MKNEEGWVIYPLEDKNVNEIVLPEGHVADLRRISRSYNELVGVLMGVIKEKAVYSLGHLVLGEGDKTSCSFDTKYRKFYNELMRRSKIVQPTLTTILYHNHLRLPLENYPDGIIRGLEEELKSGIFDYLWDYGVRPTIHEAIAEQSRQLSDADISATFGRVHILITDTKRMGADFSHINAYKFDPNSLILGTEIFRVTPLSYKSKGIHFWAGGVCSSLKKVYEGLKNY